MFFKMHVFFNDGVFDFMFYLCALFDFAQNDGLEKVSPASNLAFLDIHVSF